MDKFMEEIETKKGVTKNISEREKFEKEFLLPSKSNEGCKQRILKKLKEDYDLTKCEFLKTFKDFGLAKKCGFFAKTKFKYSMRKRYIESKKSIKKGQITKKLDEILSGGSKKHFSVEMIYDAPKNEHDFLDLFFKK